MALFENIKLGPKQNLMSFYPRPICTDIVYIHGKHFHRIAKHFRQCKIWRPSSVAMEIIREGSNMVNDQKVTPTFAFPQFLQKALCFLLYTVLNAPLPHPKVPQGHDGETPDLPPSHPITEKDSYQDGKQELVRKPTRNQHMEPSGWPRAAA